MNSGFAWTLFNGGGNIFAYKQTKHQYKASTAAAKGTVNDVLQEVVQNYYNLVLSEVMLQIRVKVGGRDDEGAASRQSRFIC